MLYALETLYTVVLAFALPAGAFVGALFGRAACGKLKRGYYGLEL